MKDLTPMATDNDHDRIDLCGNYDMFTNQPLYSNHIGITYIETYFFQAFLTNKMGRHAIVRTTFTSKKCIPLSSKDLKIMQKE